MKRFVVALFGVLALNIGFAKGAQIPENPFANPEYSFWINSAEDYKKVNKPKLFGEISDMLFRFLPDYLESKLQYGICNRVKISNFNIGNTLHEYDDDEYVVDFTYTVEWMLNEKEKWHVGEIDLSPKNPCNPRYWLEKYLDTKVYTQMSTSLTVLGDQFNEYASEQISSINQRRKKPLSEKEEMKEYNTWYYAALLDAFRTGMRWNVKRSVVVKIENGKPLVDFVTSPKAPNHHGTPLTNIEIKPEIIDDRFVNVGE